MKQSTLIKTTSILMAASLYPGESNAALSIVGDTVEIWGTAQLNGSETLRATVVVADPEIEYTSKIINDIFTIDLGISTIELVTLSAWYSPWFDSGNPPTAQEFRGIQVPANPGLIIGSVDVRFSDSIVPHDSAPVGYPAFSANNVSFGDDFVRLTTGPYLFPENSRVLITMNFIPEPSSVMLAIGTGGFMLLRRKRSSRFPRRQDT